MRGDSASKPVAGLSTDEPSQWLARSASSTSPRSSPRSASVLSTQGRSRSLAVSIIATGATWLNVTARGAGDSAASITARAATACWWVTRNPAGPFAASPRRRAAVPQPVLPFVRVGGHHLLGYPVDVADHDPGHTQRGGAYCLRVFSLLSQLPEQPVVEARVPDPVGAQQRGQRRAPLRQPACVFHGRGRRLHGGQVDPGPHHLQAATAAATSAISSATAGPSMSTRGFSYIPVRFPRGDGGARRIAHKAAASGRAVGRSSRSRRVRATTRRTCGEARSTRIDPPSS